jgi:Tol biopolymer transport system component
LQPLDGGPRRVLVNGGGFPRLIEGGAGDRTYLVFARNETLMAAPFDLKRLDVVGKAVPVIDDLATNASGGAHLGFSATGSIAYVSVNADAGSRDLVWASRDGKTALAASIQTKTKLYALAPDGKRVAYYQGDGSTRDVWIVDLASQTSKRLTSDHSPESAPIVGNPPGLAWSPDGKQLAYGSGVPVNLFRTSVDQPGEPERLATSSNYQTPSSWSPDGKSLAYVEFDPLSGGDIWVLTFGPGQKAARARPFLQTPFNEVGPAISPDGRWLAYYSNESGRFEVYIQPFPSGGRRVQVSTNAGIYPKWSANGRELVFRSGPTFDTMMSAAIRTTPDLHAGVPVALFDAQPFDGPPSLAANAERLLMMLAPALATPTDVKLVLNWRTEVAERVH